MAGCPVDFQLLLWELDVSPILTLVESPLFGFVDKLSSSSEVSVLVEEKFQLVHSAISVVAERKRLRLLGDKKKDTNFSCRFLSTVAQYKI